MASQSGGPYSGFYEKLQLPHALVQRYAVSSIFQKLKSGPAHSSLNSPIGEEAFTRCLTSTQPAVVDQTVKEICNLCREGKLPVERGLQELQSALDSVGPESVGAVVNGIGYLCRLFIQNVQVGAAFTGKSGDILGVGYHPLVKTFQMRQEVHQHILQQVHAIFIQSYPRRPNITLQFLQPFISFILMQSSASSSNVLFARDLHRQLSFMTFSTQSHGLILLKMLISYIQFYPTDTVQDFEVILEASKELVSALEKVAEQTEVQVKNVAELGLQLLSMIVGSCHELLSRGYSFYHSLLLIRKVMTCIRSLSADVLHTSHTTMVSLAHMLVLVDTEQEQLLLLDLGLRWLEDIHANGKASVGPASLFWLFPSLHVMSYPSVAVKSTAVKLLHTLEKGARSWGSLLSWPAALNRPGLFAEQLSWGGQHLAVIVFRLAQAIWTEENISGKWLYTLSGITTPESGREETWFTCLNAYLRSISQRTTDVNSASLSLQQSKGLLASICVVVTVCLIHPKAKIALAASECLALIGKAEPIWGVSLLPVVLFCLRFRGNFTELNIPHVQLGLLKAVPSLGCHSTTLPLVIQALQPMLNPKTNICVQATAVRVLCKTWELTDRAFPYLQKMLRPEDIHQGLEQAELLHSRAACIRDVSEKDPDRGVDIVLTVQACIESSDTVVLALGLQSLAVLCKEDVIDFYTAWMVIAKYFRKIPTNPTVLQSLCLLLRYGALDAAAYPEMAGDVLQILWDAASQGGNLQTEDPYINARSSALQGILSYEVDDLETICPEKRSRLAEFLFSETSAYVLPVCEELIGKLLLYEHRERHRGKREVKVATSKLEKLLKALPGALNSAATSPALGKLANFISEFPGAALLCLSLPPPGKTLSQTKREYQKALKTWQSTHERIFVETAEHLQLHRNLIVAMLALQSWCSFISRWLQSLVSVYETENPTSTEDENTEKAANYLMKMFRTSCEEGVPRVAESATLALAALCKVLPVSSHGIAQDISMFLESRLLQDGHEHMQWSSTLALGVVATCLHATDWKHKSEVVNILLKHAGASDRGIVRGACGLALGLVSQGLLRGEGGSHSLAGLAGVSRQRELEMLVHIVLSLVQLISETCPPARSSLGSFSNLLRSEVIAKERLTNVITLEEGPRLEEDDVWAVVGLVWGFGSSVTGLEQLCCPSLVSALTGLMISWVSRFPEEVQSKSNSDKSVSQDIVSESLLAAGASLALATCVSISSRLEILPDDVNSIVDKVLFLVQDLTDPDKSAVSEGLPSPFFAALNIGAGNLVATCLEDGSHSLQLESIDRLFSCMQIGMRDARLGTWSQFGAAVGIANILGAGAAMASFDFPGHPMKGSHLSYKFQVGEGKQQTVSRPLLHVASCEDIVSSVIKKLLEISKEDHDLRLKGHAGWALAFIYNSYNRGVELEEKQSRTPRDSSLGLPGPSPSGGLYHMRALQDLREDSALRLMCSKLIDHDSSAASTSLLPQTIISLFRCLEKAPRLPALDWGGLVRRFFRYVHASAKRTDQITEDNGPRESGMSRTAGEIRQQCLLFSIAHAKQIPALSIFLDELCELARLGTLEAPLRNLLMTKLAQLQHIFSRLRLKQLLSDVQEYARNSSGLGGSLLEDFVEDETLRISFRVNVWKGLTSFFQESSFDQSDHAVEVVSWLEECMTVLISLLPSSPWSEPPASSEAAQLSSQEWSAAIACLQKTRRSWLLEAFEVQASKVPESQDLTDSRLKAIFTRCQLVAAGCLPITELRSSRTWITNQRPSGLLVDVSWAVKGATSEERREWLLDMLDTAFMSSFPVTALILMALLATCWSSNAVLLPLSPTWAFYNLPLSLPSVLSQPGWASTLDSFVHRFPDLLDRMSTSVDRGELESTYVVDEILLASSVLSVLRRTCVGLKPYLPVETRLKLANLTTKQLDDKKLMGRV
ncbi:hypothetical protein R1sor_020319 [Riccia sorocarpa]|uniref:DUF3730 domain-containing protein n=1 Tax=Riccia sorocarpa TaxID=122646 RepID=A0ABD3IJH3_9MARC